MATSMPMRNPWNPDKKHSDMERWICIYPAYINVKKTRQQGRRIPKEHCAENPTYAEIRDVLSVTNLKIGVENKQYSREISKELNCRGRIRVQLKNDDGTPCNPQFQTRDSVLVYVGDKIPQLKTRQNKSSDNTLNQQSQTAGSSGTASGVGSHKKGKGKRR